MGIGLKLKKLALLGSLLCLVAGTVGAGIYFKHYFVVSVFAIWFFVEFLFWKVFPLWRPGLQFSRAKQSIFRLSSLLGLLNRSDSISESLLEEKIAEMRFMGGFSDAESRWLERMKHLAELRGLAFGKTALGKKKLRQGFVYVSESSEMRQDSVELEETAFEGLNLQQITEEAMHVASLYWKLYETALMSEYGDLSRVATRLFRDIFGIRFEGSHPRQYIEKITDAIQRHHGVPFLVLNLVRQGRLQDARKITQFLLTKEVELDEEISSSLYWMSEIYWFVQNSERQLNDFESVIRYLYHVCFTNPDRAGFLEIDSQFYSQFNTVNELAREGFLFKETLIEQILVVWKEFDGLFDGLFNSILKTMTGEKNKIYESRETWERYWQREQAGFGKDYLYVVEGNQCYNDGLNEDACQFYEKALELNPGLRAAAFNILFCYAKLENIEKHEAHVKWLLNQTSLLPASLYVVGNSFIMMGRGRMSDAYYDELKKYDEWKLKADYYRSTFCYENGFYEKALEYARKAFEVNPNDSSISYHLSLCYNALGEKESALDAIKRIRESLISPSQVQWLKYYQFTLERDAGMNSEASQTLSRIPTEYFQDPDELEEALEFAKDQNDLDLLRRLRKISGEN